MKHKVDRLNARGETAEGDIGITYADKSFDTARCKPSVSNANIIPLSRVDEVLHPQVEGDGSPINAPDAKRYLGFEQVDTGEWEAFLETR